DSAGTNTNTVVGVLAGSQNPTGRFNSFFGCGAGQSTLSGGNNSFLGCGAGSVNQAGSDNTFVGRNAGFGNTANGNSFLGSFAGRSNTTGNQNTIIGSNADVGSPNLSNATAIGSLALVTQSNSIVLGSINGVNGANADTNVGIGITAPSKRLHLVRSSLFTGSFNLDGTSDFQIDSPGIAGGRFWVTQDWRVFIANSPNYDPAIQKLFVYGGASVAGQLSIGGDLNPSGFTSIGSEGSGAANSLCFNSQRRIGRCSSSIRYKENVRSFKGGLSL